MELAEACCEHFPNSAIPPRELQHKLDSVANMMVRISASLPTPLVACSHFALHVSHVTNPLDSEWAIGQTCGFRCSSWVIISRRYARQAPMLFLLWQGASQLVLNSSSDRSQRLYQSDKLATASGAPSKADCNCSKTCSGATGWAQDLRLKPL